MIYLEVSEKEKFAAHRSVNGELPGRSEEFSSALTKCTSLFAENRVRLHLPQEGSQPHYSRLLPFPSYQYFAFKSRRLNAKQ